MAPRSASANCTASLLSAVGGYQLLDVTHAPAAEPVSSEE
jgi:hypothetical protein